MHCMNIVCIRKSFLFGTQCIENEFWIIVLWRHNYCGKLSSYLTHFITWLEEDKRGCCFQRTSILRTQQMSCRTSSVIALLGMAFDHHDHQAVRHLTSFCGDFVKKEYRAITQEAWKTSDLAMKGLLQGLINRIFYKLQGKPPRKEWTLVFKRVGGKFQHFS